VFSPVSGKIIGANELLLEEPGILNAEPYEKGWIYKIMPDNWVEDTKSYYLADEAIRWSKKELDRFRDFMATSLQKVSPGPGMVILQEGGELSDSALSGMPAGIWQDFQKEFLEP
jgi:hypothetical protein